jgi:hypothetical protein
VPVKAFLIADRFRQLVQNKTNPAFTISVGVATYPQDAKSIAALIEAADKALYESKQKGRNASPTIPRFPAEIYLYSPYAVSEKIVFLPEVTARLRTF